MRNLVRKKLHRVVPKQISKSAQQRWNIITVKYSHTERDQALLAIAEADKREWYRPTYDSGGPMPWPCKKLKSRNDTS